MISAIEKLWPRISLFLLISLIISFLFWPGELTWLGPCLFALSMGVATFFLVRRPLQDYRAHEIDRSGMLHRIALDLTGFLLPIGAAMLAGRGAGQAMNARVGSIAGLFSAFAAAFLAGLGTSLAWRRLALPRLPRPK